MKLHKISFLSHADKQGTLVAIEECKDVPFRINRVYYLYGIGDEATRGRHAHKTLQQVIVCVHGSCRILLDDGKERKEVLLDKPYEGLYLEHNVWREVSGFSSDAVLLVLASDLYDESDYIRDYDEFLAYVNDRRDTSNDATKSGHTI